MAEQVEELVIVSEAKVENGEPHSQIEMRRKLNGYVDCGLRYDKLLRVLCVDSTVNSVEPVWVEFEFECMSYSLVRSH